MQTEEYVGIKLEYKFVRVSIMYGNMGEANICLQQNIRPYGVEGTTYRHYKIKFSFMF